MPTNVQAFNLAIRKWAKDKPPEEITKLQRIIAFEGLKRIVMRTPVDTGRARGNWQVTVSSLPSGELDKVDKAGGDTITGGIAALSRLPHFQIVYISNNVRYVPILEFGGFVPPNPGPSKDPRKGRKGRVLVKDGFSTQAPRGMVNVTYQELLLIFARVK